MSIESSSSEERAQGEIAALIETLLGAERRLEELTGGEVDTVAGRDGRPFFLRRAQDQARYRDAARQAGILNALPASVALLNAQGGIVSVNDAWKHFPGGGENPDPRYGLRQSYVEVCDQAAEGFFPGSGRISTGVQAVLDGRAPSFAADFPCDLGGEKRWFQLSVTPLTEDWPNGVVVMYTDITVRRLAEETLRDSEASMAAAQRIAHFGSWEMDMADRENVDANALRWSDETFRILGFEPGSVEVDSDLFFSLVHPDDQDATREAIAAAIRERRGYAIEHRIVRPDGETRFVREEGLIVFDEEAGQPLKVVGTTHDVTEARNAEIALQTSAREQRQLAEQLGIERARLVQAQSIAKVGSWEVDLSTLEAVWSEEAHRIFGTDPATFRPMLSDVMAFVHPEDYQEVEETFLRSIGQLSAGSMDHRLLLRDGSVKFVEERWRVSTDEQGKPVRAVGTCQDVTRRKRAEDAIEGTLKRLNEAQRIGQIGDWETDVSTGKMTWSPQVFEIFGRDPSLGPPRDIEEFAAAFDPPSRALLMEQIAQTIKSGEASEKELRAVRPNGEPFYVLARAKARKDPGGQTMARYGTVQDITERKQAELSLESSQQKLLLAAESARLGIWDWDLLADKMEWDARIFELYGIREQDAQSAYSAWQKGLHPEDRDRAHAVTRAAIDGTGDFDLEFRAIWPGGEVRHIEAHALVLRAQDGTPVRMIGVNWDITARKDSERALRESEERFRKMLENVELLAVTLDTDGKVTFCNDHLLRVSGWDREEVLGTDWFSLFASEADRSRRRELFGSIQQKEIPTRVETQLLTKAGETRQVAWNVAVLRDASARVVGTASIGEDVTARKSMQEQLLQSQKMESLGSLAGGIAHDFNNLLTGILGYAELAQMKLPPDSSIQPDLEEICQSANRAATLTRQLLGFARKEVVEPKIVDLGALANGLRNLIGRLIGVDIELVVQASPNLGRVKLDPSQFEQVLVNLAVNARDAMPSGGSVVIDVSNRTVDAVQDTVGGKLQPGRYVVLTVTDTGSGMTPEVQSRVFDPFFTTKEKDKGTGLGLSTCYGIVTNCGGKIWVYSEVGVGTAFHLYFPRVDMPLSPLASSDRVAAPGKGETVLVVDDEDTVRTLAVQVLTSAGYRVLHASDGKAATGLVAEYADAIDLLVTDMVMPGMTGSELADVVRLLRPEIRVLFMSGFTDDAIVRDGDATERSAFLQKPFSAALLTQKVREVLDREPEEGPANLNKISST